MAKDSKEYRRNTEQYLISFQHAKNMFNQGIISYEELTKIEEKLRKKNIVSKLTVYMSELTGYVLLL